MELIRFHDWLFDRDEINFAEINADDGGNHDDFVKVPHTLKISLKNGLNFNLKCDDKYEAKKELNFLTAKTKPQFYGSPYDIYTVQQIYQVRNNIRDLTLELKKLMFSFKKAKTKLKDKK